MANTLDFTFNGKDKTQTAFSSLNRSVSKTQKGFDKLKGALGALSGAVAIGALGSFMKNMLEIGDRIGKVSKQIGFSAESLQELQFAASQSGVSNEQLNKSLQKFSRSVGEANKGMKAQKEAFEEIGVATVGLDGKTRDLNDILFDVIRSIEQETDVTKEAKIASDLFGRSGVELLNFLNLGEEGVKKLTQKLRDYGGVIKNDAIKATEDFNDYLDLLSRSSANTFTWMIRGSARLMKKLSQLTDKLTKTDIDPFKVTNQSTEDLQKRLTVVTKGFETLGEEYLKNNKMVMQGNYSYQVRKTLTEKLEKQHKKLVKLQDEEDAITKQITENVKTQNDDIVRKKALIESNTKVEVEGLGGVYVLQQNGKKLTEETLEVDKDLLRNHRAKNIELDGMLYTVEDLTLQEAQNLVQISKQVKRLTANQKIREKSLKTSKAQTKELKKQRAESARVAGIVLSGIRSSGAAAARFFDALNIQIKQVGDSFKLSFETNWVAIVAKLVMSSKIVSGFINKLFSGVGNAIDKTIGKIFPFLTETEETFDSVDLRLKDIATMVDQLNDAQFGYMNTLRHLTDDARALVIIESDYQKNKKEAKRLNSGYLSHLADQNNMLAKMAHHISSMRRATDAFKSSVISYIDALEQSGFTNLQKELSMTLKGFIRGPLQNFNKLITESKEVSTTAKPALVEALEQETSLKALGKITDPGELVKVLKSDKYLKDVFSEQLMAWEKMQSGDLSLVALGQNVEIFKKFGEVLNKELGKLGGDDGIIDVLTKSVSDASSTITTNTDLLNQASGGLTVMLKDSLKADFEAGKSKLDLVTDITAVANLLEDAGLNIKTFTDYIETLTSPDATGSMGGLFKKYPYGGKIYGPGHSGGGVNANLEGGEFVMSRSAVNKYGSDFMSSINNGSLGGQVQVNIYDGTGERISEFDSAIRVEINDRAGRFNEFPALAV